MLRQSLMRLLVLFLILSAAFSPMVAAEEQWRADGWLSNLGGPMVEDGDEIGCYGIPGLSWGADPGAVAIECRNYITERIDASISFRE